MGEVVRFGGLEIVAKACRKRPPEEQPESAAFLDIRETKVSGGDKTVLFAGWMFASSPALSAMEHPVYDIWVLELATGETRRVTSDPGNDYWPAWSPDGREIAFVGARRNGSGGHPRTEATSRKVALPA